ncbi:Phosphopantetheine adenylyltransferase [Zancudomyces culisetae]|uniref:Phosphopantetheine adenylyltransferase n=1 Tax=Zancudomyces culisetae TaxID=1213189 RepID=A0A1R1PVY1_ZANCU|nr:Phosphopantetheine adenylyltransferase [Zancudomyces culisetae]|eukprot:OMH85136.1 Phosphopantetheine adenylyltransferase [Zancudomyces culisetae]
MRYCYFDLKGQRNEKLSSFDYVIGNEIRNSEKGIMLLFSIHPEDLAGFSDGRGFCELDFIKKDFSSFSKAWAGLQNILSFFYITCLTKAIKCGREDLEFNVVWIEGSRYLSTGKIDKVSKSAIVLNSESSRKRYLNLLKNIRNVFFEIEALEEYTTQYYCIEAVDKEAHNTMDTTLISSISTHDYFSGFGSHVAVGGTFDHIHIGHKILLSMTAYCANSKVTCGLTSDVLLVNKKYKEFLEPYDERKARVLEFLECIRKGVDYNIFYWMMSSQLVPLYDPFGPIVVDETIDTLVVSKETLAGCDKANDIRKEKGMQLMNIVSIELIGFTENGINEKVGVLEKMSSTQARKTLYEKSVE